MLEKGTWAGIAKLKDVCKTYGWFQVLNLSHLFIAALILTWSTSRKDWLLFVSSGKDQASFFFPFCLDLPEFVWIRLKASSYLCSLSQQMWNMTVCGFTDNLSSFPGLGSESIVSDTTSPRISGLPIYCRSLQWPSSSSVFVHWRNKVGHGALGVAVALWWGLPGLKEKHAACWAVSRSQDLSFSCTDPKGP